MGFEVLFVSADAPHNLRSNARVAALGYDLLSDSPMETARAVAYRVDDFTVRKYEHFGIDLEVISGEAPRAGFSFGVHCRSYGNDSLCARVMPSSRLQRASDMSEAWTSEAATPRSNDPLLMQRGLAAEFCCA